MRNRRMPGRCRRGMLPCGYRNEQPPHHQAVIGMAAQNFPGFGRKVFGGEQSAGANQAPGALAAIASTSTLNSGRVKPDTIISVEAGGGRVT
jgi:hypothetical protein